MRAGLVDIGIGGRYPTAGSANTRAESVSGSQGNSMAPVNGLGGRGLVADRLS